MRRRTLLPLLPLTLPGTTASAPPPQCNLGTSPAPFSPDLSVCIDAHITSPRAWHPWTHQPFCIRSEGTPFCVFTSAARPAAGGYSVVASPDEAAGAVHPLQHALDRPFFAPAQLYPAPPYAVRDVPGKGKGAVATRRIGKGRVVLVDAVRVLARVEYPPDVRRADVQRMLAEAVGRLREPGEVEGLARKGTDEEGSAGGIEDVMVTNTFGVTVGGTEYMALFANLARFNHACKPNAFIHFSETALAMTVWAARDIEPGEEITITYSPAGLPSKERRDMLQKVWGFNCECSLCTAPKEEIEASDARREEIRELQDRIVELAQSGQFHRAVEAAERMFGLIDDEGMAEQLSGLYEIPARLYYQVGNLEKALEFALKVKHEIDGYGFPGKMGEKKLEMLKGVIGRIERELKEKAQEGV